MTTDNLAPVASPARTLSIDDRDLFGRRSVVGAIVVVAVLSFFGFGLQAIADSVRASSGFAVGEPQQVTEILSFTIADGWVNDPTQTLPGTAIFAQKNGWQIKVVGGFALQPGQSVEDLAKLFYDIPAEPGTEVSDLTTFTTASGLHGVTWEVHSPTISAAIWMVVNGDQVSQVEAAGPSNALDTVEADLVQMATSVTMSNTSEVAP
jgi:hypothetical protein